MRPPKSTQPPAPDPVQPCERLPIEAMIRTLRGTVRRWQAPSVSRIADRDADPFRILISTVISLRTRDETTLAAAERLFGLADTPSAMVELDAERIARAIYPAGFYRTKAVTILEISRVVLDRYGGRVPDRVDDLVQLKGVGRKTANLVVGRGYGRAAICVDTHVHRIVNRWGWVRTRTPEQTERALQGLLPRRYWIPINGWLVVFGQQICTPQSPRCSGCSLVTWCRRDGVRHFR